MLRWKEKVREDNHLNTFYVGGIKRDFFFSGERFNELSDVGKFIGWATTNVQE